MFIIVSVHDLVLAKLHCHPWRKNVCCSPSKQQKVRISTTYTLLLKTIPLCHFLSCIILDNIDFEQVRIGRSVVEHQGHRRGIILLEVAAKILPHYDLTLSHLNLLPYLLAMKILVEVVMFLAKVRQFLLLQLSLSLLRKKSKRKLITFLKSSCIIMI